MSNIDELPEFMITVIDGAEETRKDSVIFSAAAREAIREIAAYARGTRIYGESRDQAEAFWSGSEKTVRSVYLHMLDRIVNAPTEIHRDCSVLLIMPMLDELLAAQEAGEVKG